MKYLLLLLTATSFVAHAQTDWPSYGNDPGGMRFSPLKQINKTNVSQLKPAWTYQTGELKKYEGTRTAERAAFEATPIEIGSALYFSTPTNRVFSIDAATGAQRWIFDPEIDLKDEYSEVSCRGVTAWPLNGEPKKIFCATIDGRLICLDPKTGKKITDFGRSGEIDLKSGYGELGETSPPAVIGKLVIVGSSMGDNQRFDYPHGVIRAYDVETGVQRWTWDPLPSDTSIHTGGANAWSILSVDPERDLVFIPTTSPSPDYYGGLRKGSNGCANSIVALKASTGKEVWHFQVVHHDLWDFDIAAQPVLIDLPQPAVVVGTKMGFIYVLDRLTGKPIFPVEEKPVPVSDIEGEVAWPTQPFPLTIARVGLQDVQPWGPTPEDSLAAVERIAHYRYKGPFTPPSFQGSIMSPGNVGGIHWGGMCYDPKNQLLITNVNRVAAVIRMIPREKLGQIEREDEAAMRAETGRQRGTNFVMKRDYLFKTDPQRGMIMQTQPPFGSILAIDLKNGAKKWETPLGYMLDPNKYPEAKKWGSLNFGGAIVTAGGLVFVAASLDGHLRAFDEKTGALLWEYKLPVPGQATPMTYSIGGKQYLVICAGGHGKLKTQLGDYVLAFSL